MYLQTIRFPRFIMTFLRFKCVAADWRRVLKRAYGIVELVI